MEAADRVLAGEVIVTAVYGALGKRHPKSCSRGRKGNRLNGVTPADPQARTQPRPRYEREQPGEIVHLDIKKPGRFNSVRHRITGRRTGHCSSQAAGWEFAHVAVEQGNSCSGRRSAVRR